MKAHRGKNCGSLLISGDTEGYTVDKKTTMTNISYLRIHNTPSKQYALKYKQLLSKQHISVIDWHTAHRETSVRLDFCTYVLVCSRIGMCEASTGSLLVSVNPQKKPKKDADRICTMAVFTSLISTGQINTVHLHFVCPKTHFKLYHTLRHTLPLFHTLILHTKLGGTGLHTQDTGVYVIPKTLMRHFLECKVFRESGVSLKILTSL